MKPRMTAKSADSLQIRFTKSERNQYSIFRVEAGMDESERAAIRDEGYDPDDPAVVAALVRSSP
jgi:hypothetical protein